MMDIVPANSIVRSMMPGEHTWTEPEHPHFIRAHLPLNEDLQRSVVSKFDCAAPRVNVQVVGTAKESCPEEAEFGVPYEEMTLCLRRVR